MSDRAADHGRSAGWLAIAALLLGTACPSPPPADAPRLVVISVDTLRADRLGCYGYARPTSPNLDALAAAGTLVERVVAPSPWTLPSHVSLMTGLYPHRHGVKNHDHRLRTAIPTLAGRLGEAGLKTMGIVSSQHLTTRTGFPRGFAEFLYVPEWSVEPGKKPVLRNPAEPITDRALDWLAERRDDEAPFFLFLHYYDPHSDYAPEPSYRERFVGPYEGPLDGSTDQLIDVRKGRRPITPEDARHVSDLYDAEIRQLDEALEPLFAYLDRSELAATTHVVVTSDHGEEFLEHGSVLHGRTYYDEVVGIPLLIRGPGVPAGHRDGRVASLVDVAPTVLALLGLEGGIEAQGRDLSAGWRDPTPDPGRTIFSEADWMNEVPEAYRMARDPRYKLIRETRSGRSWLYDLETDPGERSPIDDPSIRERLAAELDATKDGASPEAAAPLADPELERLKALGYAED